MAVIVLNLQQVNYLLYAYSLSHSRLKLEEISFTSECNNSIFKVSFTNNKKDTNSRSNDAFSEDFNQEDVVKSKESSRDPFQTYVQNS